MSGRLARPRRPRADVAPASGPTSLVALKDAVDQAVLERLLRGEEAVALHVALDLLLGLPVWCA